MDPKEDPKNPVKELTNSDERLQEDVKKQVDDLFELYKFTQDNYVSKETDPTDKFPPIQFMPKEEIKKINGEDSKCAPDCCIIL